jgi:hypothetical protein
MTSRKSGGDALRRYLLGDLTERDRQSLERVLLASGVALEEVLALEDELRYEYAQGGLSPEERRRFEERFLRTAEGGRRLERAQALLASLGRPVRRLGVLPWLAVAASLALATGVVVYLARGGGRTPRLAGGSPVGVPGRTNEPSSLPAEPSPLVVTFALEPGVPGESVGDRRATVPRGAALVRLELSLPPLAPAGRYRVVVRSAAGHEVWRTDGLTVERPGSTRSSSMSPPGASR